MTADNQVTEVTVFLSYIKAVSCTFWVLGLLHTYEKGRETNENGTSLL